MEDLIYEADYLIEETYGFGNKIIKKMSVLDITKKCYKIQWEDGSTAWYHKCEFDGDEGYVKRPYKVIEKLNKATI